eukprot:3030808-Pyramimonas_sp.AAC.2
MYGGYTGGATIAHHGGVWRSAQLRNMRPQYHERRSLPRQVAEGPQIITHYFRGAAHAGAAPSPPLPAPSSSLEGLRRAAHGSARGARRWRARTRR